MREPLEVGWAVLSESVVLKKLRYCSGGLASVTVDAQGLGGGVWVFHRFHAFSQDAATIICHNSSVSSFSE